MNKFRDIFENVLKEKFGDVVHKDNSFQRDIVKVEIPNYKNKFLGI